MAKVSTTGFGFWKKTVVEHNGKTDVYSGNAKVDVSEGSTCVTETGVFTENSTCYLEKSEKTAQSLPDGQLVGKSKNIAVERANGKDKNIKVAFFL